MSKIDVQAKGDYIIAEVLNEADDKPFEVVDNSQPNNSLLAVSVGEDVKSCKVGDKILPSGQEFQAFPRNGVQYIILTDNQIFGVVK